MTIRENLQNHPIRAFALLCVAATSAFLAYLALKLIGVLSSPTWCSTAIQAEKITPGNTFEGLTGCIDILKIQLSALALNSQIVIGTFAMCLGVLVVIVIAGARLAGSAPGGVKFDVSRDDPGDESPKSEAAKEVAGAAVTKAKEIVAEEQLPPMQPKP